LNLRSLRAVHAATTPSNAPDRHAAGFWPNGAQLAVAEAEGAIGVADPLRMRLLHWGTVGTEVGNLLG
jgi:hypothetical protein